MDKRMTTTRLAWVASFLLLTQAGVAWAETCDAGHGCSITCKDGCSAVYNEDTGQCSKACGKAVSASGPKNQRGHVNAVFRDASRGHVEQMLKTLDHEPTKK